MLKFGRPVPMLTRAVVSSGWSRPRGSEPHRALDIPLPIGTPVLAVAAGQVIRLWPSADGDAGIWVGLRHAGGEVTRYMHLSRIAPGLQLGQAVRKGQLIGLSGHTGNSATPHLHFDLSVPASMLAEVEREAGRPKVGWGQGAFQDPYGYKIPSEPWIPVDEYSDRTRNDMAAAGVVGYRPPHNTTMLVLGAAALVGYLIIAS